MNANVNLRIRPGQPLRGTLAVPGDKSISHRALMLGAIASGPTHIHGFLPSADTEATLSAFRAMGIAIDRGGSGEVTVHGAGRHGLRAPATALDLGNSGTAARLLAGVLAGQSFEAVITGDDSLRQRPMGRVAEPLLRMGARLDCAEGGRLPMHVHGGVRLKGIDYRLPVASAQIKSAVLLAGLYAEGKTCVTEPAVTRDHTERMLRRFGVAVDLHGPRVCVSASQPAGQDVTVPGDISSAAFFLVAASIIPGSELTLTGVGINPTRAAVIDILRAMGGDIRIINPRGDAGEPMADLVVRHRPLQGVRVPAALVPIAIDEFPALLAAAAFATGRTVVTGAGELRVKESDRIAAMAEGLAAMGITAVEQPDGIEVSGGAPVGAHIESRGDHRIAMAFAVAGLAAAGETHIMDCRNIDTSFPGFGASVRAVGGDLG